MEKNLNISIFIYSTWPRVFRQFFFLKNIQDYFCWEEAYLPLPPRPRPPRPPKPPRPLFQPGPPRPPGVQPPWPRGLPQSFFPSLLTALCLGASIQDGLDSILALLGGGSREPPLLFLLLPSSWIISLSYKSHRSLYPCRRGWTGSIPHISSPSSSVWVRTGEGSSILMFLMLHMKKKFLMLTR